MKAKIALVAIVLSAFAAPVPADERHHKPAASAAMADGEVRRVDREGQKITIRHGPIPSLDMDQPMTMVFRVRDPAVLERLKPGDKVRFQAEKVDGAYTVTRIEPAK